MGTAVPAQEQTTPPPGQAYYPQHYIPTYAPPASQDPNQAPPAPVYYQPPGAPAYNPAAPAQVYYTPQPASAEPAKYSASEGPFAGMSGYEHIYDPLDATQVNETDT